MSNEKRIIYLAESGGVAVIIPAPECLRDWPIEAIAAKDVPYGLLYKIVDADDIPSDRTFRAAWEIDVTLLTDGVGDESNEFPKKPDAPPVLCGEEVAPLPEEAAPLPEEVQP